MIIEYDINLLFDIGQVVINLNSLASSPIEGDPHFTREPAVALNTHRIRYLLGKGKAVVSEVRFEVIAVDY